MIYLHCVGGRKIRRLYIGPTNIKQNSKVTVGYRFTVRVEYHNHTVVFKTLAYIACISFFSNFILN